METKLAQSFQLSEVIIFFESFFSQNKKSLKSIFVYIAA